MNRPSACGADPRVGPRIAGIVPHVGDRTAQIGGRPAAMPATSSAASAPPDIFTVSSGSKPETRIR
jgi:hypothetical protein